MDSQELTQLISDAIEDTVLIDTEPTVNKGAVSITCEDDAGNTFTIKVTQTSAPDIPDASESDPDSDLDRYAVLLDADDVL